jgi:hypothetical protein
VALDRPLDAGDSAILSPYLTSSEAAVYLRYRSASAIRTLKMRGLICPAEKAGIKKRLTARFMRRTFQDLGRQARVHDFVVRAISGHATSAMQERYSSVAGGFAAFPGGRCRD